MTMQADPSGGRMCRTSPKPFGRMRGVVTAGVMFVLVVVLVGWGRPPAGPEASVAAGSETHNLQVLESGKSFYDVPLYAMMHYGFAKQNHLNLSYAQFNSGGGSTGQIFAGGTGNILIAGIDGVAAIGQKGKLDVTVIGTWTKLNYFRVVSKAGSPYHTLQDLRGQIIAVSGPGSFSDYALRNALRRTGIPPDAVKIAGLGGPPAQLAALESGHVAAANLNPPTIYIALKQHKVRVIYNYEREGLMPSIVFTVRTADVRKDPIPYANFMKTYTQVMRKMKADPAFALEAAKADWGGTTSPDILQAELHEFLSDPGVWSVSGQFTKQLYDNGRAMLVGSGEVSEANFPTYKMLTHHAPTF